MQHYNFFDSGSPYLFHPLLTEERSDREVDFLLSRLTVTPPARILDIGCAFGRHSIEFAKRGFSVVGIDPSSAMIEAAQGRADKANCVVDFRQEFGETFDSESPFDVAICLFTTLGQIREEKDNSALIANAYRLLKPGGYFCVEVPQRAMAVQQLNEQERFGNDDVYTLVTRRYDAADQTVTETFEVHNMAQQRQFHLRYRLYAKEELEEMLMDAGFSLLATYADATGTPLAADDTADDATLLFICRKP